MNQADWNRINTMLVECATALLSAFGTQVVHDPSGETIQAPRDGILAIIGFGGDQIRGSLLVSANRGMLSASCPVPSENGVCDLDALQDWGGELANQLLGRLKSRLLAHRVTILLGTPMTVSGLELRVRSRAGDLHSIPLCLYSGSDWFVVRLDAVAAAEVTLASTPEPGSAAAEGDMLLF